MEVCSEKMKELSESVESLDKEELKEKLAKYRTDRRLSVPRVGTDLPLKNEGCMAKGRTTDSESKGADGGLEESEGEGTPEQVEQVEDCDEVDLSGHAAPSRNLYSAAIERAFQAGLEGHHSDDDDDESEAKKTRENTELLLNIMETEKEKRQRRGSWKSVWDEDDPEEDSKINEDIENDPGKRLLWAAENNEMETAREILSSKPDLICITDEDGYTPLHRATYNGHKAMVELLLEKGADLYAKTGDGWQPLHCAARWNNPHVASLLLQAGCDVNAMTNGGQTALHLAASNAEAEEVIQMLIMSRYIDITLKNGADETAYDIARRTGRLTYLFEMRDPHMLPSTS
ncbi:ankyrin repeat domain-containing protein 49-like [Diadema antillarum]